jgi:hypothetical protein
MKHYLMTGALFSILVISGSALAQETPPSKIHLGGELGLGAPSGAHLGVVLEPKLDWLQLEAGLAYNYLAFGGQASLRLDPLALLPQVPVGVFGEVEGGFFPVEKVPGHTDLPGIGYDYASLMAGLRLGKATGFHWSLEGGESFLHFSTSDFQSIANKSGVSGLFLGNPSGNAHGPCLETTFTLVF